MRGGFGRFTQQHPIFTIVKGGVGGRNGQVTLNLAPSNPLFPTFPNALPSLPAGSGPADPQHPGDLADLENECAWTGNFGVQRQLGARASVAIDANINRGQKHGFLDVNAPASIPKEALNAANGATPLTTVAQADLDAPDAAGRPTASAASSVLTNEGRFWYQGVRFSGRHQSPPLTLHGVLHAVEGRGSAEPLVRARGQQRSRARSRPHRRRHAAQLRRRGDVEHARGAACSSTAGA